MSWQLSIMKRAKFWPALMIAFHVRTTRIFPSFESWAHKPVAKGIPDYHQSFVDLLSEGCKYTPWYAPHLCNTINFVEPTQGSCENVKLLQVQLKSVRNKRFIHCLLDVYNRVDWRTMTRFPAKSDKAMFDTFLMSEPDNYFLHKATK